MGEGGEACEGDTALLAVSDRDPGGDELIWTGATVPSATRARNAVIGSMNFLRNSRARFVLSDWFNWKQS